MQLISTHTCDNGLALHQACCATTTVDYVSCKVQKIHEWHTRYAMIQYPNSTRLIVLPIQNSMPTSSHVTRTQQTRASMATNM